MAVNFICTPPTEIVFLPDADPCGQLGTACCMIPENDLNGGMCDDTTVAQCFDGDCIQCGFDGGPACTGAPRAAHAVLHAVAHAVLHAEPNNMSCGCCAAC